MNSIKYLNNFSTDKIVWDKQIQPYNNITVDNISDTVLFTLDTENTNFNNEKCITYATQLMEFGKKSNRKSNYSFIPHEDRKMLLFTHPIKFWEYVHNMKEQKLEMYVFNAEYDVNNLLNFAIKRYNLKEQDIEISEVEEYDGLYKQESSFLKTSNTYIYSKINRNGKIYKCDIQFNTCRSGKTKGVKKITIYDMAKKLSGTLKANVESFTSLKMNKADLDYSLFRDYGHTNYKEEELLYMWNDVYCLADLTMEYVFSGKYKYTEKLTTSSMALANYKDELRDDFIDAIENTKNPLHHLTKKYITYCKKTKVLYLLANGDSKKYAKQANQYYDYCSMYEDGEIRFIKENFFTSKEIFLYLFPTLSYDNFDYIRNSYCGGITRFHNKSEVGKWLHGEGMGIDINSSFPYSYTTFPLPYGKGKLITDMEEFKFKKDKVYITRFMVTNFKIKENKEPNISKVMISTSQNMKKVDTWVKEFHGQCMITCTSADYDYFIKNYTYAEFEIMDCMEFNALAGFFNRFTNKFYGLKCQKGVSPSIRSWVKLILNGVYGKFGQNKCADLRRDKYNPEENCIEESIEKLEGENIELLSDGVYLPLASFVTSYSRLHLLEVLNIINETDGIDWKYCDTDSAYVIGDVNILKHAIRDYIDLEDTGELGRWEIEKYFDKLLIIGIKKYIYYGGKEEDTNYSYHCTLSGINGKYFKFIEKYCEIEPNCIRELSEENREFIKQVQNDEREYYVSDIDDNPFIYMDKQLTKPCYGAYRSIRKKTVKDGQILYASIYCIKGDVK